VQPDIDGPSALLHAVFWSAVGKRLAGLKQIQAQTDGVSSHNTPYQMLLNHSMSSIWIQ
jgi:hypothetical protein